MKKIVLFIAFAAFSIYGFSQNDMYGVRAGYNISNLDFEPTVPGNLVNKHRNGIAIGFFAQYAITESLAFVPEVQFSAEGGKENNIRLDYIQVPLFVKLDIREGFSFGLGPQIGIKAHDYQDGLKNFAFSALAGIEYMITEEFFADVRYSYGLTNVLDQFSNTEAKNTNLQIGVGVRF